jgi:CheY-like chemotaxis protein
MGLAGVRVLLVEDEPIIAMTAEDMLEELGCTVVGTVATLSAALEAVEGPGFDVVLLDINLNGTESHPVADRLRKAGRPFVFTTGYGTDAAGGAPVIAKPYQLRDLEAAISEVLGR